MSFIYSATYKSDLAKIPGKKELNMELLTRKKNKQTNKRTTPKE